MNTAERTQQLERTLTELLGKMQYTHYKRPCTGKYRGYCDYGLTFEDGTSYFISLGKQYYLRNLTDTVEMYQFFHNNQDYLTRRTQEVIERDNRQATALGLSPIEFVRLELETGKDAHNLFWVGFIYKQNGLLYWHTNTDFHYACRGVGFNEEKSVEVYFDKLVFRADDRLGCIRELGSRAFTTILLGCLHT